MLRLDISDAPQEINAAASSASKNLLFFAISGFASRYQITA
nr:K541 [uncultured bacterium]